MGIGCTLFGHKVNRAGVWFDGFDFRGDCARCGTPMIRDVEKNWRLFVAADRNPDRDEKGTVSKR